MVFFYKREVAPLASPPMIRKDIDLKVVLKLVLKQLLDYDSFGDTYNFYSRKASINTRESSLLWIQEGW